MATGGISYSLGSADLSDVDCDPCQEDGELHTAVGMCVDCRDYLCERCFNAHNIARAYRKHELLDKESMLQSQSVKTKDKCIEECSIHEDKVIEYYCINHCHLGCSVCITLDHRSCDSVIYIPHAAKNLADNEEYKQTEKHLKSVVQRFNNITDDIKQKSDTLEICCSDAVKDIQKLRIDRNKAFDKIEIDIIKKCETLKSKEQDKMEQISNKFKNAQKEMQSLIETTRIYQNNQQNCKLFTVMMKMKDELKLADEKIKEAEKEQSNVNSLIQFVANNETLETMKHSKALGQLSISGPAVTPKDATVRQMRPVTIMKQEGTKTIVGAEYIQEVNVKSPDDQNACNITGLAVLSENRVALIDYWCYSTIGNGTVKLIDVKHDKVITNFKLSSSPFDVAMINNDQIAVTLPRNKQVALVNVAANTMNVDRKLQVGGECYGVDYKEDKLAVTFNNTEKIQVLTLEGRVLHTITIARALYVVFGHDNTSLYVSSPGHDKVVHIKFDGTTVDTYTHHELKCPQGLVTSTSGNVYVCGRLSNNIHQITLECKKGHVFLTKNSGINHPCAIGYNDTDCMVYVGMCNNNKVEVYKGVFGSK